MRGSWAIGAGAVLLAVSGCTDDSDGAADTTSSTVEIDVRSEAVAATEVVVGDCLRGVAVGVNERTQIESARVVSCHQPHELEVFASFEFDPVDFETAPPGAYPGEQATVAAADAGCASRLAELVDEAVFGLIAIWPTVDSWQQGDRSVACAAFPADQSRFESPALVSG